MKIGRLIVDWMGKSSLGPWFDLHVTVAREDDMPPHDEHMFALTVYRLSVSYIPRLRRLEDVRAKVERQGIDWDCWYAEYCSIGSKPGDSSLVRGDIHV